VDILMMAKAAFLGAIDGLTELLPVSSTAHLSVAGAFLGITGERLRTFDLGLQAGVALALVFAFRRRIFEASRLQGGTGRASKLITNIVIGFLPAAAMGACAFRSIQGYYFSGAAFAGAIFVGSAVMMWVERHGNRPTRVHTLDDIRPADALWIGLLQCLGLIVPGIGRTSSTVVGGMLLGLSRMVATEFSLFLASPTLVTASAFGLWQARDLLSTDAWPLIGTGLLTSFVCALGCVRWLTRFLANNTYFPFAWYRNSVGIVVIATLIAGAVKWTDA
jgi:undecaprenyl-diphosphatase